MMEDILANGLPIIAMWTAKYGEGGFYVLTSADCGPAFYMDMGKAGAARFVKPKTNVNLTGFSLDECRVFTLGHVYIMEGVTPWVRTHGAQPANNMLLASSLRSETRKAPKADRAARTTPCIHKLAPFPRASRKRRGMAFMARRHTGVWSMARRAYPAGVNVNA